MFKSNPLPWYVSGTFLTFWILHCFYSVACVLGPLITSGLTEAQKAQQSNLISALIGGIFLPPVLYLLLKFVPAFSAQKYLCLAAPLFLVTSVFFTVRMYQNPGPKPVDAWLKLGTEQTVNGLTLRYLKHEEKVMALYGQEPWPWKSYYIEVKSGTETGELILHEKSRSTPVIWKDYSFSLGSSANDESAVYVSIMKKAVL